MITARQWAEWVCNPFFPSLVDAMLNFDGHSNGDGHGIGKFKHSFTPLSTGRGGGGALRTMVACYF